MQPNSGLLRALSGQGTRLRNEYRDSQDAAPYDLLARAVAANLSRDYPVLLIDARLHQFDHGTKMGETVTTPDNSSQE